LRTQQKRISTLAILGIVAIVGLVAIIIATGIREASDRTADRPTDVAGPATLGQGYVVRPFSARTLDGNTVDNSFFAKQRLTMVNVWGTFCGPCIKEMPDLAQLPTIFPSTDFAILGIIADTPDTDNETTARRLVSSAGATYTNIIPDSSIQTNLLADIAVVPTTFFVSRTGKVVAEVLTGSRTKTAWQAVIEQIMKDLPADP